MRSIRTIGLAMLMGTMGLACGEKTGGPTTKVDSGTPSMMKPDGSTPGGTPTTTTTTTPAGGAADAGMAGAPTTTPATAPASAPATH
jgi:hypothetical protein